MGICSADVVTSFMMIYTDGCLFAETGTKRSRIYAVAWDANFVIGTSSVGSDRWANIELDNMLAWDEELSQEEVWRLVIQKGQV